MSVQLNIDKPCYENWDDMQPNKDGRHCLSCQKTVVDFSNMTDREILNYISNINSEICGRADRRQLNRELRENNLRKRFSWKYIWKLLIVWLVFAGKSKAQGGVKYQKVEQVKKVSIEDSTGIDYETLFKGNDSSEISVLFDELDTFTLIGNSGCTKWVTYGFMVTRVNISMMEKMSREFNEWFPKKDVVIYPNPINTGINIQVALQLDEAGDYRLDLIDINGRVLHMQSVNLKDPAYKLSIPTKPNWAAGVYWIRITGRHTKKKYTGKVVLQ